MSVKTSARVKCSKVKTISLINVKAVVEGGLK